MLYHKLEKLNHFLRSRIFVTRTINRLNQKGFFGKSLVKAYQKTIKGENIPEENEVFKKLNQFRKDLSDDKSIISFEEIGSNTMMTVAEISDRAASPEIWTRFFYHLTKISESKNILEIGTNLGVSGQYFLQAIQGKKKTKFISLEGVKGLCDIAEKQFKNLSSSDRFEIHQGLYDQTLINLKNRNINFDLVFIDGNHQYDATLKFFESLKNNLADKAWVIFDDIHWSPGMRKAWSEICLQKGIVFSVNFFKLGIVLFDSQSNRVSQEQYHLFISV